MGQGDPGGGHQGEMKRRVVGIVESERYETSPPHILTPGSRRYCAADYLARCRGANLSDASSAHHGTTTPAMILMKSRNTSTSCSSRGANIFHVDIPKP